MEHITLITTGGTIDKVYGRGKGIRDLHIGRGVASGLFLKMELDSVLTFHPKSVTTKDSLDLNDDDRKAIADACVSANTSKIIITHGTDTMVQTAQVLSEASIPPRRTIVLTGAALPACVKDTDAELNLGLALGVCLFALPGIYIVLNGVHHWNQCAKDAKTGIFEPV